MQFLAYRHWSLALYLNLVDDIGGNFLNALEIELQTLLSKRVENRNNEAVKQQETAVNGSKCHVITQGRRKHENEIVSN